MGYQLEPPRPAARGLGLPEGAALLRHDHPAPLRWPGLLALRAFRGGAPHLRLLGHRRRHRDGAQLARTGRAADAVRHAGATRLLAAAPGRRARDSLLRPDQPRGRLGRGLHDRHRRGLPPGGGWARADRHPAELAQALHHAGAGGHGAGAGLQAVRSRRHPGRAARHRHLGGAGAGRCAGRGDRPAPSARHAGLSERSQSRPRRVRAAGRADRRRGTRRPRLADADERAGGRAWHFAALAVGGGGALGAHATGMYARARAVRPAGGALRGRAGKAGQPGRQRLPGRGRAPPDLRGPEPGRQAGRGIRHHEISRDRAHAPVGQRRHGRARGPGRDRRAAQLPVRCTAPCPSPSRSKAPTS